MPDTKLSMDHAVTPRIPKFGVRYYQYALMFFTLIVAFAIRTSLSVSIISMTTDNPPNPDIPTYPEWDNKDLILSSFFWGYIIPQISAGQLSEHFGPKWFLFGTMTITAILNIVIPPMAAALGSTGVIVCRALQGLNQGFIFPSIHNLVSRWSPFFERARVSNFVYAGAGFGIAIAMPITSAIADSQAGWPWAFYGMGGAGLIWVVVFAIFVKNAPKDHGSISEEERRYIEESNSVTQKDAKKLPTPWKKILTSVPVWAILVAGIAQCWGSYTLLTQIPSYMDSIMDYNMKSNGLLSALPYIGQSLLGLAVAPIADKLISTKTVSITTTRKMFGSLATFVPAAALVWLAFVDSSQKELTVVLLVIAVSFLACIFSGYMVNAIDLAPNHAGTIVGFINGSSNIFSILGPMSVGWMGTDKTDLSLWRTVFLVSAGIFLACGLFYATFASAELQTWNDSEESQKEKDEDPREERKKSGLH